MSEKKTVRLRLTAKHTVPEQAHGMLSMFQIPPQQEEIDGPANPEDYPEEMNDALQDMLDRDAGLTEGEIYEAGEQEAEEMEAEENGEENGDPGEMTMAELFEKLEELARKLTDGASGDEAGGNTPEDDAFEFRTLGEMTLRELPGGGEGIEISYQEDDSMDGTATVILYDPSKENAVSIYHTGAVMSTLVCEQGKRHISTYQTPYMPFEVAVYTKKCTGSLDFAVGGHIELDYLVELRGADIQRTEMVIDAAVIG